jgi:hypothetical protein
MSEYIKQNFTSGQVLKAEHLNHMEDGIENLSLTILTEEQVNELIDAKIASLVNAEEVSY